MRILLLLLVVGVVASCTPKDIMEIETSLNTQCTTVSLPDQNDLNYVNTKYNEVKACMGLEALTPTYVFYENCGQVSCDSEMAMYCVSGSELHIPQTIKISDIKAMFIEYVSNANGLDDVTRTAFEVQCGGI